MAKENSFVNSNFKIGILGGGQLGKMLALAAQPLDLKIHVMDAGPDYPAAPVCNHFTSGNFKDFSDVYQFGKTVDLLTIEIEHVNTPALHQLVQEGLTVHPHPSKLDIIKDKYLQKQFYRIQGLPTSYFKGFKNSSDLLLSIQAGDVTFPFVQKSRTAGYDGRGVAIIRTEKDLDNIIPGSCLIESLVDIDKEIAVIVARNEKGQMVAYPPVEMEFNPQANLVERLVCPADLSPQQIQKVIDIATRTIEVFEISGLLAVELFLTRSGEVLINEVAPRPHNSGHHTIESCVTSQFEQHLRAILNWPLGSTKMISPSVMVNLLGAPGFTGRAIYNGLEECLATEGAHLHLYGKTITKPFRKMGHATVLDEDLDRAKEKANFIKENLKIIA